METPEASITTADTHETSGEWSRLLNPWRKASLAVLPTFLITRILFLLLTHFAGVLLALPDNSSIALSAKAVLYSWYHWDTPRILAIASTGYPDITYTSFFPLYPMLVHLLSSVFHMDILLAGILISNVALYGALIVLYRMVESEWDQDTAKRCILYLVLFPTALILFDAYNSSLLLFLTVLCLYQLRRGNWWLAGCIGGLAALTDLFGATLLIVFYCELYRQQYQHNLHKKLNPVSSTEATSTQITPETDSTHEVETITVSYKATAQETTETNENTEPKEQVPQTGFEKTKLALPWKDIVLLLSGLPIVIGIGIYALALQKQLHDAWAFLHPQGSALLQAPWSGIGAALHILFSSSPYTFAWTHSTFELLLLALSIILITLSFIGKEKFNGTQWPLLVFGIQVIIYALLLPNQSNQLANPFDPLPGIQTTLLLLIPGFIVLARLGRRAWFHQGYLLFALPLLTFLLLELFKGNWAM